MKMDTISTTASGNFDNKKSFSGIRKHLEHDPKLKHKNAFLNTSESQNLRKYNTHKVLMDFDDWAENHFGSFVKEHDENMKDKRRKFGSVKRFLQVDGSGKARKLQPLQLYTQKLSNEKDYSELVNQLTTKLQGYTWASGAKKGQRLTANEAKDQALKAIAQGLADCAEGFNKRNKNLFMFEYYIHMDEKGSAHFHSDVMPFYQPDGVTKKGRKKKPSWSLNTALAQQYGTTRSKSQSKTNLSTFREQEDKALIESVNKTLENKFGIKNALSFVRLTDKDKTVETGKDHDVYVAQKQKLDDLQAKVKDLEAKHTKALEQCKQDQAQAESQQKVIAENQGKLDDIANWQSLVATYQSQAKDAEQEKKDAKAARDQALQAQRQAEEAKKQAEQQAQQANQSLIDQLNQQKQKQDAREINLSHHEKGYTDSEGKYHIGIEAREKAVTARESAVAKKESALADYDNKIAEKKKTLKDYSDGLESKKKSILKTKNDELRESYKKNKRQFISEANRAYKAQLDQRADELTKRENSFKQRVKRLVHTFKFEYIMYGLTQNETVEQAYNDRQIQAAATNYATDKLTMNRTEFENMTFGGDEEHAPYPRLKAFVSAIKHTFIKKDSPFNKIAELGKSIGTVTRAGVGGKPKQTENVQNQNQNTKEKDTDDSIDYPF